MGGARTALFNYLFAKQHNGVFVLRIEDTDRARSKPEWEEDIVENLKWLQLEPDEGPEKGKFGPYRQSERTEIYRTYLERLLTEGKAYYCFCSTEEIDAQRQDQISRGEAPRYVGTCRGLTAEKVKGFQKEGKPSVIRFQVPDKEVVFKDLIRGEVKIDSELMGDMVIAKDLDTPLYNLAVVVDDYEMQISHVIRGEDHISNTPKQILLQEALQLPQPQYAHLPLILAEDRTKLSKRHGNNSVTKFREEGYLPEATINFLALLGWNPGDNREIFDLASLIKEFSLERVHKGGAVFGLQRLEWLNAQYIKKMPAGELRKLILPYLEKAGLATDGVDTKELNQMIAAYQERLHTLAEAPGLLGLFFVDIPSYEPKLLTWKRATKEETKESLVKTMELLEGISEKEWSEKKLSEILLEAASEGEDRGKLLWPLRVAVSGAKASAGPFEIAAALQKKKTLQRIQHAISLLEK